MYGNIRSRFTDWRGREQSAEGPRTLSFRNIVECLIILQISLKQPHAIPFSKKNAIRPFEDTSSLEFWARKNDASMFVVGQSTKKRPAGLTIARTFDFKLLDMCELGIDKISAMSEFKVRILTVLLQLRRNVSEMIPDFKSGSWP